MFGGIIPSTRVSSSMSMKTADGKSCSVKSNVAKSGDGMEGFRKALAVAGGRGRETQVENGIRFPDTALVLPTEAEAVCAWFAENAITGTVVTTKAEPEKTSGRGRNRLKETAESNGTAS
jgi:hypothetical protein